MTYGTEQPLTASTPRATSTSIPETQTTDTHHQIVPGMSEHLYPTLVADASLSTPTADNCSTLQNQITSEIDKYPQELWRGMKEMIITLTGGTWLLIHQAHSRKLTS